MKKNLFVWTGLLVFISSLGLFFWGSKIDAKLDQNNTIFVSNSAISSLVKAVVGDELEVKILGSYSENFHQHSISPNTSEDLKKAKMLLFTSRYDEPSVYSIAQNLSQLKIIEIFEDEGFLKNIYDTYYSSKQYSDFIKNKKNIDPHFWLSAVASSYVLEIIFDNISVVFPDKVSIFKKNYDIAIKKMHNLVILGKNSLEKCNSVDVFAVHDAFFYLQKDYNFKYNGGISDNLEHGFLPNKIAELIYTNTQNKICLIFNKNNNVGLIEKIHHILPNIEYIDIDFDGLAVDYKKGIVGYEEFFTINIKHFANCTCK